MSAQVATLLKAVTVTTTGDRTLLEKSRNRDEVLMQVAITGGGSASVSIEGRLDSSYPWVGIAGPYTASSIVPIAYCPEVRAIATIVPGAVVSVGISSGN